MAQGTAIGIDLGVERFATQSDGVFYEPLNRFRGHEQSLRKAQQALSRKRKFSKNWRKAKAKVQRIHGRSAHVRGDYLHKVSSTISKNHAMVFVEDLQVGNLSRSAGGTIEAPGKQVRAKSGLNKSILDQGWRAFRRQLEYKVAWAGGHFDAVPARNTSRTCPSCKHVAADNRRTRSRFACVQCGYADHADVVGAINIRRAGLARIACEVSGAVMPPAAGTHRSDSGAARCCA